MAKKPSKPKVVKQGDNYFQVVKETTVKLVPTSKPKRSAKQLASDEAGKARLAKLRKAKKNDPNNKKK